MLVSGHELGPSFRVHASRAKNPSQPLAKRGCFAVWPCVARWRMAGRDSGIGMVSPEVS